MSLAQPEPGAPLTPGLNPGVANVAGSWQQNVAPYTWNAIPTTAGVGYTQSKDELETGDAQAAGANLTTQAVIQNTANTALTTALKLAENSLIQNVQNELSVSKSFAQAASAA